MFLEVTQVTQASHEAANLNSSQLPMQKVFPSMPSSFQTSWATTFTPPGPTCATGSDATESQ